MKFFYNLHINNHCESFRNQQFFNYMIFYIKWIIVLCAFMVTFPTTNFNADFASTLTARLSQDVSTEILAVICVLGLIFLLKKSKIHQLRPMDLGIGLVLSALLTLSQALNNLSGSVSFTGGQFFSSITSLLLTIVYFIGFSIFFANIFVLIRTYFGFHPFSVFVNWIEVAPILLICWLIEVLPFLPGTLTFDATQQLDQFSHLYLPAYHIYYAPTNHHPWGSTLFFGSIFNFGKSIAGADLGILLITICQIIIALIIFSKVVLFVYQHGGKKAGFLSLLFFCSPIFGISLQAIEKTTLYTAFSAWFVLTFLEIVDRLYSKEDIHPIAYVSLCCSAILMCMFRNDGNLVVILSLLLLVIFSTFYHNKKKFHSLITSFVIILAILIGWNKVALPLMKVAPTEPIEALTIPLRQVAYTYETDPNNLTKSQQATLNKLIPLNKIPSRYNVNQADALKWLFPTKNVHTANWNLIKLWLTVGLRHPITYLSVYIQANTYYFNPFLFKAPTLFTSISIPANLQAPWFTQYSHWMPINLKNNFNIFFLSFLTSFPPVAIIFSSGLPFWVMILLLGLMLCKLPKRDLLYFIPFILFVLVPTLSTLNGETRYANIGLALVPLFISAIWNNVAQYKSTQRNVHTT